MHVLDAIGNTSLVKLRHVVPEGCADVFVKLEWENPTGSMKDRVALAMVEHAEQSGALKPGGTVVEYTGGSTGTSLAFVCRAKGYRTKLVSSDAFSQEKRDHMAALGAELIIVPSDNGLSTKKMFLEMIETARELSKERDTYWTNQIENVESPQGYFPLGEDIWRQTNGRVDAFVQGVGTGASSKGVATALRRHNSQIELHCWEPAESPVLSGGDPGAHRIEGVGIGFVPTLWDPAIVNSVTRVSTGQAMEMARRLAREEGLFAGTSSGANVVTAIEVAKRLGPGRSVVTLMIDSGLKYVSTDLYRTQAR